MEMRNAYIVANSVLLVLALYIALLCFRRHLRNPQSHSRPVQTTFLRFDGVFALYVVLFYIRVLCTEDMSVYEPVEQFIFPVLEGVAIFSFFNLMLYLVGGTEATVRLMDPQGAGAAGAAPDAWLASPSKKKLDNYRRRVILFLVVKPILGAVDGWAVHHEESHPDDNKYRIVHGAISVVSLILTITAIVGVLQTYRALHHHIPASFQLTPKFITIKALLLVSTLQWSIANAIVGDWDFKQMYIYSTICMGETLGLTLAFQKYFTANETDGVPRLETASDGSPAAPFRPARILAIWDLFQYPITANESNYVASV
ncbi:hypothetical protein LEN26_000278 [Aphanomyces euteiches]|nr:hypothetical protein AeMF1_020258 [Aphanomyces euteiches]KAH9163919.1 hypothetical protein LEN26_000278 [Aphanomyces euteiches]